MEAVRGFKSHRLRQVLLQHLALLGDVCVYHYRVLLESDSTSGVCVGCEMMDFGVGCGIMVVWFVVGVVVLLVVVCVVLV